MLADHYNFLAFDINDEGDAVRNLFQFAMYVL